MAKRNQGGVATLGALNLGYNGYTDPTLTTPRQWAACSNVYSGQNGNIKRARFAPVISKNTTGYTQQNGIFKSLFNWRDSTPQALLVGDVGNKQFTFNIAQNYTAVQRFNPMVDPDGSGLAAMAGPWSRAAMLSTLFEMNGQTKQTARGDLLTVIEGWGLDAPDTAPDITTSAGGITKSIGRSYAFAWENSNKNNVGAPSPATDYVAYVSQQGTIKCIQIGTVSAVAGSRTITGTGTAFTEAWVGRRLWIDGVGGGAGMRVVSVETSTSLTVDTAVAADITDAQFQIYDPQITHVRLYGTADGGATYFRTQRNLFDPTQTTLVNAGLQFTDNDNSEPPDGNFTTEVAQSYNIPPPIGKYVIEYQSRLVVFGVEAAPQAFFYSNIELTEIGNAPECFAPLNQVALPLKDGKINGMAAMPTGLVVWSDRNDMFKVSGLLSDNSSVTAMQLGAAIQRLPYQLGCASPYAVVSTPLGVIWLTSTKEVWLYTDSYAPRNIGRPVQDILATINPDQLADARMEYIRSDDKNWVVLALSTGNATQNSTLLILDLDMLASNGAPSYYLFDLATNQPTWYVFNVVCEAVSAIFDNDGYVHLLASDYDRVLDVTYRDGMFSVEGELEVPDGYVKLHAAGNEDSHSLKKCKWIRFLTNQPASTLADDGWLFGVEVIDDDVYTFDEPYIVDLHPEVHSPILGDDASAPPNGSDQWPGKTTQRSREFSPAKFVTQGLKQVEGRRLRFVVSFPKLAGKDYEFRGIQAEVARTGS